ncbi:MAG: DUF6602 domain-containing protein [bacterium]
MTKKTNKRLAAKKLINTISSQLNRDFECLLDNTNRNTKGYQIETAVKDFLEKYLNVICNFYVRAHIIDNEMEYLDVLPNGQNEIDIVGIFKNAYPALIWNVKESVYVPYDAVALIMEVKNKLTKGYLSKDLEKFKKISLLKTTDLPRFTSMVHNEYSLFRPIKILIYFDASIKDTAEKNLLNKYKDSWDILVNLKKDLVLINKELPFYKLLNTVPTISRYGNDLEKTFITWKGDALFKLIIIIAITVTIPSSVNAVNAFLKLYEISGGEI